MDSSTMVAVGRHVFLLLPVTMLLALAACQREALPGPSASSSSTPAPAPKATPGAASTLAGTWKYAPDPKGQLKADPIYKNASMTYDADGGYAYALGSVTLKGRWTPRQWGARGGVVDIEYTRGRKNVYAIRVDGTLAAPKGLWIQEKPEEGGPKHYFVRVKP